MILSQNNEGRLMASWNLYSNRRDLLMLPLSISVTCELALNDGICTNSKAYPKVFELPLYLFGGQSDPSLGLESEYFDSMIDNVLAIHRG